MVKRAIIVLMVASVPWGIIAGVIGGVVVPEERMIAWMTNPWRFGFIAGIVLGTPFLASTTALMWYWRPLRRYVEGSPPSGEL